MNNYESIDWMLPDEQVTKTKEYTLFWLTGKSEIAKGNSPDKAMALAGYGGGAIKALDFYAEGDQRNEYEWRAEEHTWRSKNIQKI